MRTAFIFFAIAAFAGIVSCDDDEATIVDPIYEFIAFDGESSVNLNEFENSEEAFPLTIELLAFKPRPVFINQCTITRKIFI